MIRVIAIDLRGKRSESPLSHIYSDVMPACALKGKAANPASSKQLDLLDSGQALRAFRNDVDWFTA